MKRILAFIMMFVLLSCSFFSFALDINQNINTTLIFYENNIKEVKNGDEILSLKLTKKANFLTFLPMTTAECDLEDISSLTDFIIGNVACGNTKVKNFDGVDMAKKLSDFQKNDGSFGENLSQHFYAMLALDMYGQKYDREAAFSYILSKQLENGSFSDDGKKGDMELTALAIIAMADRVTKQMDIMNSANNAITFLNNNQLENGGFKNSDGKDNSITLALVISALSSVGADPKDERWRGMLDSTERFKNSDGSYRLLPDEEDKYDKNSTSKMLMALTDAKSLKSAYKSVGIYTIYSPMKNTISQIIMLIVIFTTIFVTSIIVTKRRTLR